MSCVLKRYAYFYSSGLQSNSKSLSEQIGKKDERIQVLEQTNSNQQALLDGLFYTIIGSEKDLDRVMKRGSTKSDIVNYALSETFGNPAAYIEEFSKRVELGKLTIEDEKDNVVKFQPKQTRTCKLHSVNARYQPPKTKMTLKVIDSTSISLNLIFSVSLIGKQSFTSKICEKERTWLIKLK